MPMACWKVDGELYLNALNADYLILRYITMRCIALHNMCISVSDLFKTRWKLHVRDLGLIRKQIKCSEDTTESKLNRMNISNWLWMNYKSKLPIGTLKRDLKIYVLIGRKHV